MGFTASSWHEFKYSWMSSSDEVQLAVKKFIIFHIYIYIYLFMLKKSCSKLNYNLCGKESSVIKLIDILYVRYLVNIFNTTDAGMKIVESDLSTQ